MYKKYGNKLACFSPPVMLATLLIEFGLAVYTIWRYKLTAISRTVAAMLILLGVFQLAEYMICGGLGLSNVEWARVGYIAITLLPPLGIHLVLQIAKAKKFYPVLIAAYGTAFTYAGYFVLTAGSVVNRVCSSNYAVFDIHGWDSMLYALYYYGWLIVAVALAAHLARKQPKVSAPLRWLVVGYAAFIIPTTIANMIDPTTLAGIPSIMCGFAVLLAIILVWQILPLSKVPKAKR